jgi:hypothetical protein
MRARLGRGENEAGGGWTTMTKDEKTIYSVLAINLSDTKEEGSWFEFELERMRTRKYGIILTEKFAKVWYDIVKYDT